MQMKLANYFIRQFTDHISTFEPTGSKGSNRLWIMSPESMDSMGIWRVSLNDPMCVPLPKVLLCLNEAIEWGYRARTGGMALDGTHDGPPEPILLVQNNYLEWSQQQHDCPANGIDC